MYGSQSATKRVWRIVRCVLSDDYTCTYKKVNIHIYIYAERDEKNIGSLVEQNRTNVMIMLSLQMLRFTQ